MGVLQREMLSNRHILLLLLYNNIVGYLFLYSGRFLMFAL